MPCTCPPPHSRHAYVEGTYDEEYVRPKIVYDFCTEGLRSAGRAHLRWCTTSLLPLPPGKTARAQHGVLVPPSTTPYSALPSLFMYHLYNTKTIVPGQYTSSIPCQPTSQARPACGSSPLSLVSAAPWGLRGTLDRPSFDSSQPSPGSGSCAAPGPVAGC